MSYANVPFGDGSPVGSVDLYQLTLQSCGHFTDRA